MIKINISFTGKPFSFYYYYYLCVCVFFHFCKVLIQLFEPRRQFFFVFVFFFRFFNFLKFLIFCCNFSPQFFFFCFSSPISFCFCSSAIFSLSKSSTVTSFFCTAPGGSGDHSLFEKYPSIDFWDYFFLSFHFFNFR